MVKHGACDDGRWVTGEQEVYTTWGAWVGEHEKKRSVGTCLCVKFTVHDTATLQRLFEAEHLQHATPTSRSSARIAHLYNTAEGSA